MPNLKIVSDNALERASTLTASTTAGTLVVANLANWRKSSVHRGTGTDVTYTATWGASEPIGCVALPFCNLSPTAQMRVRASNELGTTNLLKYTETFNAAPSDTWARPGTGTSGITANVAMAPNGTMSADRLNSYSGGGTPFELKQLLGWVSSSGDTVFSASIFGQAAEWSRLTLALTDMAGNQTWAEMNLSDGRLIHITQAAGQNINADVIAAPNGFYRLKLQNWSKLTGATTPRLHLYPGYHTTPGSAGASNAWTESGLAAAINSAVASPYPGWHVDEITESNSGSNIARASAATLRGEVGRTLVLEQTVKTGVGTARYLGVSISGAGGATQGAVIDSATGTVSFKTNGTQVTNITSEDKGGGWYCLKMEVTPTVAGTITWQLNLQATGTAMGSAYTWATSASSVYLTKPYAYAKVKDNTYAPMLKSAVLDSYTTDASKGLNVWGGMLEAGPLVTSYYPSPAGSLGVRPDGYLDSWQGAGYDSGWVLACPWPAAKLRGFTAAQAASAYAYGGGTYARHWLPQEVMARSLSVEISDPANVQGYVEAACMVIGPCWSPKYNADYGATLTRQDSSSHLRTAAGELVTDSGTTSRKMRLSLAKMPPADRAALLDMASSGQAYPWLVSLFPQSADLALERDHMIYGKRSKETEIAIQYAAAYNTSIEIEEI